MAYMVPSVASKEKKSVSPSYSISATREISEEIGEANEIVLPWSSIGIGTTDVPTTGFVGGFVTTGGSVE